MRGVGKTLWNIICRWRARLRIGCAKSAWIDSFFEALRLNRVHRSYSMCDTMRLSGRMDKTKGLFLTKKHVKIFNGSGENQGASVLPTKNVLTDYDIIG